VPFPDMALQIVLAFEEVIKSATVHRTGVICGGLMDGVNVTTEVLRIRSVRS
jgi:hypothetical protein